MQWGVQGVGADLSRGMLDQARQIFGSPLAQMDMTSLAFEDESFTGVW